MHLYVEDVDDLVQRAADHGVQVVSPVQEQPYGDREATIADPFGIVWFVATHVSDS
jgi:PhnB protein